MIRIVDPADPRIEHYLSVKDRDLAGRGRRFIAEGEIVIRALLGPRSLFSAESLLLSEARAKALSSVLRELPPDLPVYVAPPDVMDGIVGFHIHRGALAIGLREEANCAADLLGCMPDKAVVLCLVGLANHDNVGGAFRNAAAFGADAVLLDRTSCDPLYRKALRVAVGAPLTVPFRWTRNSEEMLGLLSSRGFTAFALSPRGDTPVETCAWPRRTALIVGAEGPGLPASLLERVPTVRIGMAEGFDSLNVATATGIALHALRSRRRLLADE